MIRAFTISQKSEHDGMRVKTEIRYGHDIIRLDVLLPVKDYSLRELEAAAAEKASSSLTQWAAGIRSQE